MEEVLVAVEASGLWYLLQNAPNVIDKDILQDRVRCIDKVRRLDINGHFSKTLHNQLWKFAYNTEDNVKEDLKKLALETVILRYKANRFDARMQEIKSLQRYLQYVHKKKQYKKAMEDIVEILKSKR